MCVCEVECAVCVCVRWSVQCVCEVECAMCVRKSINKYSVSMDASVSS